MKKIITAAACLTMTAFVLAGCSGTSGTENITGTAGITDEMWKEYKANAELEVFKRDGKVYTTAYEYELPGLAGSDDMSEGKHYKLTADVTFLNGGVAGYVDYPQIERVISIEEISQANVTDETNETGLSLIIDGVEMEVEWEDNAPVKALKEIVKDKPLEIQMSMYGGFEQVGDIGTELPAEDVQTTTKAGDIVLYEGDKIVVFYGANSWSYTRLGHITGKTEEELAKILGEKDVTLVIEKR